MNNEESLKKRNELSVYYRELGKGQNKAKGSGRRQLKIQKQK